MAGTPVDCCYHSCGRGRSKRGRRALAAAIFVALVLITARARPAGAVCGNQTFEPGEQCELGPNGDAACPRACIPPGHSDECTCAQPAAEHSAYALLAEVSARLCSGSQVVSGHVGVLRPGGALTMGKGSQVAPGSEVVADRISMFDSSSLDRLFANAELFKTNIAVGDGPYRFPVPLALNPALPALPSATPGPNPVSAEPGVITLLPPGVYGNVSVFRGATLLLRGTDAGRGVGSYDLRSLSVQAESRVLVDNPVDVRISDWLFVQTRASIGPSTGATQLAGDIRFSVNGPLVRVGHSSRLRAHLRAAGSVRLGKEAIVIGRIIANKIKVGGTAKVQVEGGCGDGTLDAGEVCDGTAPGGTAACTTVPCAEPGQPGQCTCN